MLSAGILLLALQAANSTPIDPQSMNPAQRRFADAVAVWGNCAASLVADRSFPNEEMANDAADQALAACRAQDDELRAALDAASGAARPQIELRGRGGPPVAARSGSPPPRSQNPLTSEHWSNARISLVII